MDEQFKRNVVVLLRLILAALVVGFAALVWEIHWVNAILYSTDLSKDVQNYSILPF